MFQIFYISLFIQIFIKKDSYCRSTKIYCKLGTIFKSINYESLRVEMNLYICRVTQGYIC